MSAYYNENDKEKAAWLRELIRQNVVAPGDVDERSIVEVEPEDLRGYIQCHFFAGIGVWSYALRLAGWPDDRPVWTGSCPCPSFSCAGKGEGFDDPRHLWPHWDRLIGECGPPAIFGEQADDAIGYGWLDLVYVALESKAYSVGSAVLGAGSVGAPHIRQRLYFCAHSEAAEVHARPSEIQKGARTKSSNRSGNSGDICGCWDPNAWHKKYGLPPGQVCGNLGKRPNSNGGNASAEREQRSGEQRLLAPDRGIGHDSDAAQRRLAMHGSASGSGGHAAFTGESGDRGESIRSGLERLSGHVRDWRGPGWLDPLAARSVAASGATRGFWGDCDWWHGKDEKYRPIEPGLFPLVTGATNRVLKLRGYGDAIVPQVAAEFIRASEEALGIQEFAISNQWP